MSKPTPNDIKNLINEKYRLDISDAIRDTQHASLRFCYAFLCVKYCLNYSYSEIGKTINRDHSSVIYAVKKITSTINYDKRLTQLFNDINESFLEKYPKINELTEMPKLSGYDKLILMRLCSKYKAENKKIKKNNVNLKRKLKRLSNK